MYRQYTPGLPSTEGALSLEHLRAGQLKLLLQTEGLDVAGSSDREVLLARLRGHLVGALPSEWVMTALEGEALLLPCLGHSPSCAALRPVRAHSWPLRARPAPLNPQETAPPEPTHLTPTRPDTQHSPIQNTAHTPKAQVSKTNTSNSLRTQPNTQATARTGSTRPWCATTASCTFLGGTATTARAASRLP